MKMMNNCFFGDTSPSISTSTPTSIRSPVKRRDSQYTTHQRSWATALTLAAILAAQESNSGAVVNAFTHQPIINHLHSSISAGRIRSLKTAQQQSFRLFYSSSPSIILEDAKAAQLWGHERPTGLKSLSSFSSMTTTVQVPSRMFLKAGQISNQPLSSLSSNFFDSSTTSTTTIRSPDERDATDIYLPQRTRGVLGFSIQDHGDHLISSAKTPPSMEGSSTCLHSSTERRQSPSASSSFGDTETWTWTIPDVLEDEDMLSTASSPSPHNSNNPILNRSPNTITDERRMDSESEESNLAWFPWMPTISQIEALKVRELRKICADRDLKQAGKKEDLQQRLWEWTRVQQHRQRRLMIGSSSTMNNPPPKTFRLETKPSKTARDEDQQSSTLSPDTPSNAAAANSLGEWARTYDIEPLLQKREQIHKEKREGKSVDTAGRLARNPMKGAPDTPTKEYLSKLFDAPPSQYSNFEVKQMYAAAKSADQDGDRALSRQILYKLKEATPHDARIYRRLARMESEEGSVHNARRVLQEGLELHPSNSFIWHGLGQLEMKAGNENEGRKCFGQAIKLDPAFPNAYHAWGIFEHSKGHIARAMKILKKGLEYCPANHRLHHALGDLYREAKMLDMAERSFKRALEHGPEVSRPFVFTSLSRVAYELGKYDRCRSYLQKAVAINNGRHAKGWLAWAKFEESEMHLDASRSVCVTALNQYEKGLLKRGRKSKSQTSTTFVSRTQELAAAPSLDPTELKEQMLKLVPKYRSGDHFLKVYRNWIRLEERHGSAEAVDYVYNRASVAFSADWKLALDWARYHARQDHQHERRARSLFGRACDKVSNKHGDPYRMFGEFEMKLGNYSEARKIFYRGALALSDSPDGGLGNQARIAELYYAWAVCEWRLENLSRAEVLFDHALRLTNPEEEGSASRSSIFYAIASLQYDRGENHLAQHCICLCLKENALPGGNTKVWELWAEVAEAMGAKKMARKCHERAVLELEKAEANGADEKGVSLMLAMQNPDALAMKGEDMQSMMRKDPWHHKLFDTATPWESPQFSAVSLPGDSDR